MGDRHSLIEYAVESGVKLIILTGDSEIKEKHIEIARKNNSAQIIKPKANLPGDAIKSAKEITVKIL